MSIYPKETILEIAYAAYRVNNGYVKETVWKDGKVVSWSNREIITYNSYLTLPLDQRGWIPEEYVPVQVTDEDRENVKEAHKFYRRYTMLILGDSLNQFQRDIYAAYSKEEVTPKNFGHLAYLPTFVKNEANEIALNRRFKDEFSESKHLTGTYVEGKAEILKRIFLKEHGIFLYIAGVDGNLVNFTKDRKYDIGAVYQIRAKVKGTDRERTSGLPMTKINYVKLEALEII